MLPTAEPSSEEQHGADAGKLAGFLITVLQSTRANGRLRTRNAGKAKGGDSCN